MTGSPRWLVRVHAAVPPGGRDLSSAYAPRAPAAARTVPIRLVPIRLPGGAARSAPPAHRALAEAVASGCADRLRLRFGPEDCFAVAVAVVDGEGVGAGLGPAALALVSAP